MSGLSSLIVATALAAAAGTSPSGEASAETASLSFQSKDQMLVGTVYGIEAVDGTPRVYGERLAANVPAGRRTVSYACPGMELGIDGARLSYEFAPGGHYQLVCDSVKGAEIRQVDHC